MSEKIKTLRAKLKAANSDLKTLNGKRKLAEKTFKETPDADNGKALTSVTTQWKNKFLEIHKLKLAIEG